jgi:antitoxin YefM
VSLSSALPDRGTAEELLVDGDGLEFGSMATLPLSEVKARLSQIADEVHRTHERVTITKNGRSYVVLMSAEDLESMEATLELLADAEAVRGVEQGRRELDAGLGTSVDSMAELMSARRGSGGA